MKSIWKTKAELQALNAMSERTLVAHLGIEFTEVGNDYLKAKMPVDDRTVQPMRLLHGGASVSLAETLGSVASVLCLEDPLMAPVGIEINANHLRSVKKGFVYGTVKPVKIGRRVHIWNIEIKNDEDKLVCVSRLTTMIINKQ